jgi:hypothetical protein
MLLHFIGFELPKRYKFKRTQNGTTPTSSSNRNPQAVDPTLKLMVRMKKMSRLATTLSEHELLFQEQTSSGYQVKDSIGFRTLRII